MEEKTITFISDRQTYTIPVTNILYVMMKKQDAYVHVADGWVLKTRITFAEFQDALGDVFIRLNRGCLVSAMAIHNIDNLVNLSNGESLEYTSDHKFDIFEKFRKKRRDIVEGLADNNNPTDNNGYHEHYKCFDNMPIAFTDIEMVFDNYNQAVDWIFRYENEALARLENCPLDKLIGSSFGSISENMDTKWLRSYERAVHCGCMLFDICDTKMSP